MSQEKRKLSMEELDSVTGGMEITNEDPQAYGRCPSCTTALKKVTGGFKCPDCGTTYTKEEIKVVSGGDKQMARRPGIFYTGRRYNA